MTLSYTRGVNIRDNKPRPCVAADFGAFVDALDRDRAPSKAAAGYVAGPLNGDGRRCAEGAMPRRWLAVDLDRVEPDTLPAVRLWFAGFSGCAWATHSSTPEAPRERAIIELNRAASRAECIAIGRTLAADMAAEFGAAVLVDESTFRAEQPVFLPPTGVQLARFLGEPLNVDRYVQAAPPDVEHEPRPKASDADLLDRLARGEGLHDVLATLTARMAAAGLSRELIEAAAFGFLERARRARGARVDAMAGDELARLIDGAMTKFSPSERRSDAEPPLDIFRAFAAPPLDPQDFPQTLREFAVPLAAAAGHDPSGYLMAGLAAAAAAAHDGLRLLIDPRTSWFESPRLWVLLLGPPGSAKTPAIRAAVGALFELHRRLREQHARDTAGLREDDPKPPAPSVLVSDTTLEALSEVLAANPRGVCAVFEELDSWVGSLDAYRGGIGSKDRGEWLRLFDGGPHQVDRIKRGSYFVPNWGASILGATTPAGLRRHAKDLPADGLIQRFLPVLVRPMTAPDDSVDGAAIKAARETFEARLIELFHAPPGVVRLSPEAARLFFARRDALRAEVEAVAGLSEPMQGHLAKHAGLIARVALTMHAIECGRHACDEPISEETMARAVRLLRALARHALAMFDTLAGGNDSTLTLARAAARAVLAGRFETVNRRELTHACRAFRDAPEGQREAALRFLVDAAWLTPLDEGRQYAGRPATFAVNPEAHTRFAGEGQELKARRAVVRDLLRG